MFPHLQRYPYIRVAMRKYILNRHYICHKSHLEKPQLIKKNKDISIIFVQTKFYKWNATVGNQACKVNASEKVLFKKDCPKLSFFKRTRLGTQSASRLFSISTFFLLNLLEFFLQFQFFVFTFFPWIFKLFLKHNCFYENP